MAKFIFVCKGPATDMSDMSEEQAKAVMEAWNQWIQKLGNSLVDVGAPWLTVYHWWTTDLRVHRLN